MATPSITVLNAGFVQMLQSLAARGGKDFRDVLINQVGPIVDICVKRSPGKNTPYHKKAARLRVEKPARWVAENGTIIDPKIRKVPRPLPDQALLQTSTGTRGGTEGKQFFIFRNSKGRRVVLWGERLRGKQYHAANINALRLKSAAQPKVDRALQAIGSLKKSWVQVADHVGAGLKVKNGSYVRKARSGYDDGAQSKRVESGDAIYIDLINTNTALAGRYHGQRILDGAIQTRLRAFRLETRKGVFDDLAMRAKRYPGIFTT